VPISLRGMSEDENDYLAKRSIDPRGRQNGQLRSLVRTDARAADGREQEASEEGDRGR
jgi:hypothetical protein